MNSDFNTEYFFKTIVDREYLYWYELKFIGANTSDDRKINTLPQVIENLNACDVLTFSYADYSISGLFGNPVEDKEKLSFYSSLDEKLFFGFDQKSGFAVQCQLYGVEGQDRGFDVNVVGIKVSPTPFDNINIFNCPSPDYARYWHKAVEAKFDDRFYNIAQKPELEIQVN